MDKDSAIRTLRAHEAELRELWRTVSQDLPELLTACERAAAGDLS